MEQIVQPDPAATVIVLRPGTSAPEVLMVHRHQRGHFGGLTVFPGGGVDDSDCRDLARQVVPGDWEDHDHRAAALRELAEEAGLLAVADGVIRAPAAKGEDLYAALREGGVVMDSSSLVLVSRWVTPEFFPRRFDTRFYLLAAAETPDVIIDEDELLGFSWTTPKDALCRYEEGEWSMFLPTLAHLRWLALRSSVEDALESARGADGRSVIEPTRAEDGSLIATLLPANDE